MLRAYIFNERVEMTVKCVTPVTRATYVRPKLVLRKVVQLVTFSQATFLTWLQWRADFEVLSTMVSQERDERTMSEWVNADGSLWDPYQDEAARDELRPGEYELHLIRQAQAEAEHAKERAANRCYSCRYQTGSAYLPCTVNPLGFGDQECRDYEV